MPLPWQIPRLLNPIAEAVRSLEEMALDPVLGTYVDVGWGGVRNARMAILSDFFKVGCETVHLTDLFGLSVLASEACALDGIVSKAFPGGRRNVVWGETL